MAHLLSVPVFVGLLSMQGVAPEIMTLRGKLVCIGCILKKSSGSNSQCGLYTVHNIGLQLGDGSLWSFVDNQNGHDLIYAHNLLERCY